jgi:hypothetical protein
LADLATIYTDNIVEATNIYFTNTRVQNYLTNISGNLVPAGNALYDLGSESGYWRDLYLSGNSLYLGNILIRDESGTVTFTNTVSQTSISVGGATSLTRYIYTAANNQSVFTGPDTNNRSLYLLDPGLALVYLNGTLLTQNSDYTAYTTNVTIAEGLQANDVVSVLVGGTVDTQTSLVSSKRYTYNTASLTTVVSGADSLGQTLDLSYPEKTHVFVNGILMMPTTDYTAYASNITFTSSILAGSTVIVIDNLSQVTSNVVNSINGLQGQITLTTSNVTEGTNLYFSNARVSNAFVSSGTANAVLYLNAGNVVTSGSALTFDGTNLTVGSGTVSTTRTLNVLGSQSIERYGATPQLAIRGGTDSTTGKDLRFNLTQTYLTIGAATIGGTQNNWLIFDFSNPSMNFALDGTEGMRLTSTGLGIGTSSPLERLDVRTTGSGRVSIRLASGGTNQGYISYFDSGQYLAFGSGASTGSGVNGGEQLVLNNAGNLGLGVAPSAWASPFIALESGSVSNQWQSSVGFQTNNSVVSLNTNTFYNGSNYIYKYSKAASRFIVNSNSFEWQLAPSGTAGNAITFTQPMTLDASGRLGIGTTSPVAKLDVVSGTNTTLSVPAGVVAKFSGSVVINSLNTGGAGNVDSLYFQKSHGSGINIANYDLGIIRSYTTNGYAGGLDFYTGKSIGGGNYASTFAMRIDDNQNLGIGTTTPGTKLHVTGSNGFFAQFLNSTDGTGAGVAFGSSTNLGRISSNGASTALSFEINGTERIRMTSGGDFGIGTNNPNSKLHVNGKITQSSYALDQLNGGNQFVEIRGGTRSGTGIYSLFTRGNSNAQSSGKVYVQAIYGTPATSGYWEYIISGNLNIALIASNTSIYSGSAPSIYWDVNTLKVNNTNSNVYYSIIVELHNIGIGWGATWGDFPGFVS